MAEENPGTIVYDIEVEVIVITVRGISALICNRFSEEVQGTIEAAQQGGAKRGKAPRDPDAEFKAALYLCEDGTPGFPAIAFKKAMVRAAKGSGMTMTDARGAFHIIGELLPIRGSEPTMRSDRVVLRGTITSIAYRPQFTEWEIDVPIRYNKRAISAEQVANLLQVAGFGVGIGAWRPECKGGFGMFEVKHD